MMTDIDHLMIKVEECQAAGADFERLGFIVTPLSVIGAMGVANRLVLMKPLTGGSANFLELMSVHDPARLNPTIGAMLAGPERAFGMVVTCADADEARAGLIDRGYAPGPVHRLTREWDLGGEVLRVALDVILPMPAPFPVTLCRYRTLEHYLRPEWRAHPNGAVSLIAIHCVSQNPAPAMAYYETLFAKPAAPAPDGGLTITPGAVHLSVQEAASFSQAFGQTPLQDEGFAGYSLRSADLGRTRAYLAGQGIGFTETPGGLVLDPARTHGAILRFVA